MFFLEEMQVFLGFTLCKYDVCNFFTFCSNAAANIEVREYQLYIVQKALFTNTLVALPTGLGKTFIAAVVMYNYFRWFPEGKVWAQTGKRYLLSLTDTFENLR
jgi:hypothetical protein